MKRRAQQPVQVFDELPAAPRATLGMRKGMRTAIHIHPMTTK